MKNLNKYQKEFLYFSEIKDSANARFVKIGVTSDYHGRIKGLQTGCPFRVVLKDIYFIPNARKVESCIHRELDEFRSIGEWFELNKDSEEIISSLKEMLTEFKVSNVQFNKTFENKLSELLNGDSL